MRTGSDKVSRIIEISYQAKKYGRSRSRSLKIDLDAYGLAPSGLFAGALRHRATAKSNRGDISRIFAVIEELRRGDKDARWALSVLNAPPANLGPRDIQDLFAVVEDLIERTARWAEKYGPAFLFRQLISDLPDPLMNGETIRTSVAFRTRFSERTAGPRAMLSDRWDPHSPDPKYAPPASQTRHESVTDLTTKLGDHFQYRMNRVTVAAYSVLKEITKLRDELFQGGTEADLNTEELVRSDYLLRKRSVHFGRLEYSHYVNHRLLRLYCRVAARNQLHVRTHYFAWTHANGFWHTQRIRDAIPVISHYGTNAKSVRSIVVLSHYLPPYAVFACATYLVARTGWNIETVFNLRPSAIIDHRDGSIQLDPLKGKTDQQQSVVVPKSDHDFQNVIAEVRRHHSNLVTHWDVAHDSPLLLAQTFRQHLQVVLCAKYLRKFCRREKLPKFTFGELRPQRAAITYIKSNDPEKVRVLLGHSTLEETGHYLNQTSLHILYAANTNEFERRLGATATFAVRGAGEARQRGYVEQDVDPTLLFRNGIGSYCRDPLQGPQESKGPNGRCKGLPCANCKQHAIVITRDSIRDALVANDYFRRHGSNLVRTAPGVINTDVVLQISFNIALCEFLKKSSLASTYLEIEQDLRSKGHV
jgi:integrase-like protein